MERTKTRKKPASRIRAFKPAIGGQESDALREAVESGWLGTGILTRLFEGRLERELGSGRALATNSGTAALHLALAALEVRGGEVITTPVTSVATNHAILYNGAAPVFCDVEPETGNIDPARIEPLIGPRTRAIVAVHLGQACDLDPIMEIARRRRIAVLEDVCACHAVGGTYKGRALGTIADAGCFSFGRFKGITTLDGGAVAQKDESRHERMARLRRLGHGEEDGEMADGPEGVRELGFHYRMNDLAAALGLAQLKRREELQARLDRLLARYREGVRGLSFARMIEPRPYSKGVRAYAALRVLGGRRDALRAHLKAHGVQPNDSLYPNHLYELYSPYRRPLPAAERFCAEALHLPFYPDLSDEEADRVLDIVRRFRR